MSNSEHNNQPQWLKDLQHNSYFPELFLSGTLIAILFSLDVEIDSGVLNVKDYFHFPGLGALIVFIVPLIYSTLLGLKITLIIHFISRMIWTAYIGLSYAFKDGVINANINYKGIYNKGLENENSYEKQIENFGQIAGAMFGLILFITIYMIGIILVLGLPLLILSSALLLIETDTKILKWLFTITISSYLLFLALYIIDFISLNKLRKTKIGYYLVLPGHIIVRYIGLSFIYRQLYYTYSSNFKQWKIKLFIVFFMIGGYASAYPTVMKIMHWPNIFETRENRFQISNSEYRDRIDKVNNFQGISTIQSYEVKNKIDLFIKYTKGIDDELSNLGIQKSISNLPLKNKAERYIYEQQYDSIYNHFLNKEFKIFIDGKYVGKQDFLMEYQNKSNVLGISTKIDISDYQEKKHLLEIRIYNYNKGNSEIKNEFNTISYIPFKKIK